MAELDYKKIHISTYAICKNESKFVQEWMDNMWNNGHGPDKLYVLDTGSTDDTMEQFQKAVDRLQIPDGWLTLVQKEIKPWRFDVGRNESMKIIDQEHTDVLYCIDLDEKIIPDFWDDLRQEVAEHPNFERIYYQYAWSHHSDGTPDWTYWYDKITKPYWTWKFPVHEALYMSPEDKKKYGYEGCYFMHPEKIYLHHYPDPEKSRGNYINLLQLRADENPQDLYGLFYLAREYAFYNNIEKAIEVETQLYIRLQWKEPESDTYAIKDDMLMLPCVYCNLGNWYQNLRLYETAEFFYKKGIEKYPNFRETYLRYAQMIGYQGRSSEAIQLVQDALRKTVRMTDWRIQQWTYSTWWPKHILGIAFSWLGDYAHANSLFEEAEKDITTDDERRVATAIGFYTDWNFMINKIAEMANKKSSD